MSPSIRSQEENIEEFIIRELKGLHEQLEEVKGQNVALAERVEYLEGSMQQKDDRIKHLTGLVSSLTMEIKDMQVKERSVLNKSLNKELKFRSDDIEKRGKKPPSRPDSRIEPIQKEFSLVDNYSQFFGSATKGKNSESSLRNGQRNLANMMNQLKDAIALREMKLNQLKNMSGDYFQSDY